VERPSIPLIKAVMTPFPYSIELESPLADARRMMGEHGIRHLPVTQGRRLVGVVSERDVQRALEAVPSGGGTQVRDAYRADVYAVQLGERLDAVLMRMAARHLGSAIVLKGERIAGIFTTTDACRCFAEFLRSRLPGGGDEAA
jgi:acetoin utilization protein AcuB